MQEAKRMGQAIGALMSLFLLFCLCGNAFEKSSLPLCPVAAHSPLSHNQLRTMKITMFATENLYADMDYPFTVTVELEDLETDAQISDASVTIMAEYLGGDNPPWAVNFTAPEEGFPGFYSVTFDHTGAGDYWFTAFCSAAGYEDSSASILRTVNPYRTDPYQPFDISHYHLPFIILSSLAVTFFLVAPLLVHLALKRKDRSQVP